ncbi:MAG TPA: type I-E CRISPR-associated protein Cas5/CasD [Candidatus Binataceae bacterium]|nr:type I-E CRISPR-associated protein Cas5/CasD [Candidatus Binataceae bacterium]
MIDALILRFDAPLVSFGGVVIDANGVTRLYPARSMLVGLLGNALGFDHRDAEPLQGLQARIRYAVRCDRPGQLMRDFQTVDLSQPFLARGWTTRGIAQGRAGADATRTGIHIRYRDYLADSIYTVGLTLEPPDDPPNVERLEAALRVPARPLFIGRKPCLPAAPILVGRLTGDSWTEILSKAPLSKRVRENRLRIWLPADGPHVRGALPITDERDWTNQIHVGRRFILEDSIDV